MKAKKNSGPAWLLRTLVLWLLGISLLIFLVVASLSSLFSYSLWSWINVLRFIIGGGIVFLLICYGFFFKTILNGSKEK
ncbi:hypothetical protein A4D02_03645 [Niastella koreensis]|uniref:Uncharacterized protein n=2 Tax=Niastella koreensis TaxID=354356 RepID=G8TMT2_NIAKG|nr:hypothetical protein [Niastella koreensis]AEW03103.1 hypothetical protein Niako_6881 [Niastella koreensis GR20-10]OQP55415.1 hypothetical protein A4D02_03645 [Niastella koreensis]